MLNVHDLSISFQGEYLFKGVTFKLNPSNRVGLIGKNGAGKSTLLKLLAGDLELDSGQIATDKEVSIGFLRQDIDFIEGNTVLEEAYLAFDSIITIEKQLEAINAQLVERTDYESDSFNQLMIDLNELQHRYEILGGYNYQGNTERILQGLGFKREDFNKLTNTFSGGWRMRIELAKLLLNNHEVLLLDEPTNHLDIESILWLEDFLNQYPGAVVIVSHDKTFLDNVTNRTIEISLGSIYDFNKPYSKYLSLREELKTQQLAAQKNQQKEIAQTEKLIEKFRAKASKASMAQSLIKKLDKLDVIEVDQEDNSTMSIQFPIAIQPGKIIFEIENITKSYGENRVLNGVNLLIERGSKIAFVGQNGQGKSTLAKIMVDDISYQGNVKLGHNAKIGYFAQNQAEYLDGNKTVLNTMIDAANETNRSKVRDILGSFLFRGDEVDKYVKVLSGGERNRLALAKLMLQPLNTLVMDEPTNHLDLNSKYVLKQALKNFEGTLIVVSHDRDFLQGLTAKVYEFKDNKIKEFLGDIDYYLQQRNLSQMRDVEKSIEKPKKQEAKTKRLSYESQKELKTLNNKLSKIESEIKVTESKIKDLDNQLAQNSALLKSDSSFFNSYKAAKKKSEKLLIDWEDVLIKIDEFKNN